MYDWNDLRCFLAVAREGSTLAAARILDLNQTTVARRIEALEQALEVKLFERDRMGSRLTEAGRSLLSAAERVETEAATVATIAAQAARERKGVLRVTTNETLANALLTPCLGEFAAIYTDVQIDLVVTDKRLDVMRGEADVALRSAWVWPTEPTLVCRKLADTAWTFYCSRGYAERRGIPASPEALKDHALLGGEGGLGETRPMRWMAIHAPAASVQLRSSSISNQVVAIKAGLGVGPLPVLEGDSHAELVRCFPPLPEFDGDLLLITRADLRNVPRVRAFTDFIAARVMATRRQLDGRAAEA